MAALNEYPVVIIWMSASSRGPDRVCAVACRSDSGWICPVALRPGFVPAITLTGDLPDDQRAALLCSQASARFIGPFTLDSP